MSVLNVLSLAANLQKRFLTDSLKSMVIRLDWTTVKPEVPLLVQSVTGVRYSHRNERVFRKIRGGGRPVREGVVPPEKHIYNWRPVLPEDGQYTTRPLPVIKMGGRHPETGKVVVRTIGGGHKKEFRWVDYVREGPADGSTLEERVMQIRLDTCRTAWIALVASGDHKRWIIATDGVKVGDIVRTSSFIPRIPDLLAPSVLAIKGNSLHTVEDMKPTRLNFGRYHNRTFIYISSNGRGGGAYFEVRPVPGDAYAIGALPMGTVIHNIELTPGGGGHFCRAAGSSAQYVRKVDNKCLVQLPSKRQLLLDEKCMVVVGQVSNIEHGSIPIGSPNNLRAMGKRPRSGLWHRKDGYCGRKIRPPKSILDTLAEREKKPEFYNLTFKT